MSAKTTFGDAIAELTVCDGTLSISSPQSTWAFSETDCDGWPDMEELEGLFKAFGRFHDWDLVAVGSDGGAIAYGIYRQRRYQ